MTAASQLPVLQCTPCPALATPVSWHPDDEEEEAGVWYEEADPQLVAIVNPQRFLDFVVTALIYTSCGSAPHSLQWLLMSFYTLGHSGEEGKFRGHETQISPLLTLVQGANLSVQICS